MSRFAIWNQRWNERLDQLADWAIERIAFAATVGGYIAVVVFFVTIFLAALRILGAI